MVPRSVYLTDKRDNAGHEKTTVNKIVIIPNVVVFILLFYMQRRFISNKLEACLLHEPQREKTGFFICENKDADGDREADQRLCFRYLDSTIPFLPLAISSGCKAWFVFDLVRNQIVGFLTPGLK